MQSVIFGNANSTICRAVVDVGLHGRTSSKHDVSVANLQWSLYQQVPEIASSSIACYMVAKGGYSCCTHARMGLFWLSSPADEHLNVTLSTTRRSLQSPRCLHARLDV